MPTVGDKKSAIDAAVEIAKAYAGSATGKTSENIVELLESAQKKLMELYGK